MSTWYGPPPLYHVMVRLKSSHARLAVSKESNSRDHSNGLWESTWQNMEPDDITTARGVRLAPFQASSTWFRPPPSLYVLVRHPSSNGGSVISNVRKLGWVKSAKKWLIGARNQIDITTATYLLTGSRLYYEQKLKSSLTITDFIIGKSLIFNQFRRPTRTKASDNREPSLAAIPSADGHILHIAVLAMMSDTRFSGWLLRFFFFGAKN